MREWFIINDLDEFVDKTRLLVYNNFGSWNQDTEIDNLIDGIAEDEEADFERLLSHDECLVIAKNIVKKEKHKVTKKIRFILNEDLFIELIKSFNDRMVSNILQSLVSKGLIESSYDSEINDFIFWIKDEYKEKPETD